MRSRIGQRLFSSLLAATSLVACSAYTNEKDERSVEDHGDGFSLTVPNDARVASKFCGDVEPPLPPDPIVEHRFDPKLLSDKLSGDGLVGWVHGAVPTYNQYVFTYRNEAPGIMSFFEAEQFSLVPVTAEVAAMLATLKRHDKLRLHGSIFENGSPLRHLKVTQVDVLEKYPEATDNSYDVDLAQFGGRQRFDVFGIVHANVSAPGRGRALIVEHKDMILPLFVPAELEAAVAPIYRGDVVNIAVKLVEQPQSPPHLAIDSEIPNAVEIIDPIKNCHGSERTLTGYLVKFEQSPAIKLDVYAIRVVDANGIARNYTFFPSVPTTDPAFGEIFMGVSAKAQEAWDGAAEPAAVVRNFRKKEALKVTVRGMINVVSTEQANAQIYVDSADDVQIVHE